LSLSLSSSSSSSSSSSDSVAELSSEEEFLLAGFFGGFGDAFGVSDFLLASFSSWALSESSSDEFSSFSLVSTFGWSGFGGSKLGGITGGSSCCFWRGLSTVCGFDVGGAGFSGLTPII